MNKKRKLSVKIWDPNFRRPKRVQKFPVLIVCEDSNISQKYFKCIREKYLLKHVDIPSRKGEGISLSQLLEWAIDKHKRSEKKYSEIYIVFDKDTHPDFEEVQRQIYKLRLRTRDGELVRICASIAIPCFEYWLILHCRETTKPFTSSVHLKKEWKNIWGDDYEKRPEKIFSQIITDISLLKAIERAKKSRENSDINNRNPWTNMDELIQSLLKLSEDITLPDFIKAISSQTLDTVT